ncbi:MAG: AI-2E family transporter [Ruminococcus sp.]|nr:AI-2E family transporter [Ruminococcus sp.]
MKIRANRKYTTIAFYAAAVIAVNVLLIVAMLKIGTIAKLFSTLVGAMSSVIWGLIIAFLMNPIMMGFEKLVRKRIYKKEEHSNVLRAISIIVASLVFLGVVAGLIWIVVPELINSIKEIFKNWGDISDKIQSWVNRLFKSNPQAKKVVLDKFHELTTDFDTLYDRFEPMFDNILSGAWGFVTFVKDFVIGFFVSIYLLFGKERFLAQLKKLVISVTKKKTCDRIMSLAARINKVFSGFLVGKIIDSIIIGCICFVCLTLMNMPYNLMISVIIGVTNIIPFFGPIIGAVPSTLFMVIVSPQKALILLIFIVVLQQFDGNVLGPKILGDSTGLPGFWVLVSILFFGGLWGFPGMVIAVPTFALIYSFTREFVEGRLKKKKLPVDTDYYMADVEHLYKKPEKRKPLTPEELDKIVIPPSDEVNEVNLEAAEESSADEDDEEETQAETQAETQSQ